MATKTRKTRTITVRGTIERCDLLSRDPFRPDYYGVTAEKKEFYLDVAIRCRDGINGANETTFYFKTPAVTRRIAAPPGAGCAVVCFNFDDHSPNPWMEEYTTDGGEKRAVAIPGKPNNNDIRAKVKVGDTITVAGRVKAEKVSKYGKHYMVLTHVFLPAPEGLANFAADEKYGF